MWRDDLIHDGKSREESESENGGAGLSHQTSDSYILYSYLFP